MLQMQYYTGLQVNCLGYHMPKFTDLTLGYIKLYKTGLKRKFEFSAKLLIWQCPEFNYFNDVT